MQYDRILYFSAVRSFDRKKFRWHKEGEVVTARANENEVIVIVCAGEMGHGKGSPGYLVQW